MRQKSSVVRIIGGQWNRRLLPVLEAPGLRPTPDRVRETLFNWLNHYVGDWSGLSGLDLFAGSGVLGMELASRGAERVVMVEKQRTVAQQLSQNAKMLSASNIQIVNDDAWDYVDQAVKRAEQFDVVFLDPPYGQNWTLKALSAIVPLLKRESLIYIEDNQVLPDDIPQVYSVLKRNKAGQVHFNLLHCAN